jgi:O-glycosyl hydrolase
MNAWKAAIGLGLVNRDWAGFNRRFMMDIFSGKQMDFGLFRIRIDESQGSADPSGQG